jgi:hypothetical protein
MPSKYDENTKAKAVRLVREHADDYDSEWAAMCAISARLGMTAETLRKWVRQAGSVVWQWRGNANRHRDVSTVSQLARGQHFVYCDVSFTCDVPRSARVPVDEPASNWRLRGSHGPRPPS